MLEIKGFISIDNFKYFAISGILSGVLMVLTSGGLGAKPKLSDTERYVVTQEGTLNLRDKPVDGKVIAQLKQNEIVTFLNEDDLAWPKIRTKEGKIGFVSTDFLSQYSVESLKSAGMFGSVYFGDKGGLLTLFPIALLIDDTLVSSNEIPNDVSWSIRWMTKKSVPQNILMGKRKIQAKTNSPTKHGCQENPALIATYSSPLGDDDEDMFGGTGMDLSRATEFSVDSPTEEQTRNNAIREFEKAGATDLNGLAKDELAQLEDPATKKRYMAARYSINADGKETYYNFQLYEIKAGKIVSVLLNQTEKLDDEVAFYGGSLHYLAAFHWKEQNRFLFIFGNNGFDSHMFSIHEIKGGKLTQTLWGGGDAC